MDKTGISVDTPARLTELVDRVCRKLPDEPVATPEVDRQRETHDRRRQLSELLRPMGRLHASCTLENYTVEHPGQTEVVTALKRYAAKMREEVDAGNGIILFGPSGTGKDHLLVALSRIAIMQHGLRVVWTNGMDLYGELRDRIQNDKTEAGWVARMASPDILYVSDPLPPRDGLSPYQAAMLQRILDRRTRMMRPTWISMNVRSSAEADERMGATLVDRLKPGSIGAFCDWPSKRELRMVWMGRGRTCSR